MGKEYSYLSNSYMSSLINEINKHAKYGWRLINVFHGGNALDVFGEVAEADIPINLFLGV